MPWSSKCKAVLFSAICICNSTNIFMWRIVCDLRVYLVDLFFFKWFSSTHFLSSQKPTTHPIAQVQFSKNLTKIKIILVALCSLLRWLYSARFYLKRKGKVPKKKLFLLFLPIFFSFFLQIFTNTIFYIAFHWKWDF